MLAQLRPKISLSRVLHPVHPSWCCYALLSGVIFGIVLGIASGRAIFVRPIFLLPLLVMGLGSIYFARGWLVVLAFIIGLSLGNLRVSPRLIDQENFRQLTGHIVTLRGKLSSEPDSSSGQTKFSLTEVELVENSVHNPVEKPVENSQKSSENLPLRGTVYVTLSNSKVALERSDIITLYGELGAGFGTYAATLFRPSLKSVERASTGDIFARLKNWFADLARNFISSPEVDLGLGYLVGSKAGLSKEFADTLRLVGMTHVVVASGAHLGILINLAKRIFGKISKFSGLLFSSLLMLGFVMIVGFTPSMTRAALVTSLSLTAGYVGRKFTPIRLIILAAAITLLISPMNCINLGWQLSFASFFGILVIAPGLQKMFYGGKKPPWLAGMLMTSLATSLVCSPILMYNFGTLSLLSFVANLVILPTLPYAMLFTFLTGATSFAPVLATIFARLDTILLDVHIWLVNFLSEQKTFIFEFPSGQAWYFAIYLPLGLTMIMLRLHSRRRRSFEKQKLVT